MEVVDMKKLETAIIYLQRIADGKNPINNLPAEEDSVLNNPNVIRCMSFVKEILNEVKKNGGYIGKKVRKTDKINFPLDTLSTFTYREDKSISRFVEQINEGIDTNVHQKMNYRIITDWLKLHEFLKEEYSEEFQKTTTMPTEKGNQIGIRTERRSSSTGVEYMLVIYNRQAQEYIIQSMENILYGE